MPYLASWTIGQSERLILIQSYYPNPHAEIILALLKAVVRLLREDLKPEWNNCFVALVHFARRFSGIFLHVRGRPFELASKTAALFRHADQHTIVEIQGNPGFPDGRNTVNRIPCRLSSRSTIALNSSAGANIKQ
jgi:hypothetical protein